MNRLTVQGSAFRVAALALALALAVLPSCKSKPKALDVPPPSDDGAAIAAATKLTRDARRLELAKKPDDALRTYRQAIETYRDVPAAWHNMGVILMDKGETMAAAEAFMTAGELSPTDPRPMAALGALWRRSDLDKAAQMYDQALARDPRHAESLRQRVLIDFLQDRIDASSQDRVERALAQETDPWWTDKLKRAQFRFKQLDSSNNLGRPSFPTTPARSAGFNAGSGSGEVETAPLRN
jgi:tetratricopeptide (TPR) repeat protein